MMFFIFLNYLTPYPYHSEIDLFSFDDPSPAPAPPAAPVSDDFGAFHATPTPAPPADDDFGAFVASKAAQPDPFATPVPQPVAVPNTTFDAFGNNSAIPQSNTLTGNVQNVTNAFGNMNMGQPQQVQAPSTGEDEFGDFADAAPKTLATPISNPSDPFSKLVSLDGLSKNPRNNIRKFSRAMSVMTTIVNVTHLFST